MSIHASLKKKGSIAAKRSVLKRFERLDLLREENKWKEGDKVLGLRKTKPTE